MKYLSILVFAAICFSSGDSSLTITKYELELDPQDEKFGGSLKFTLSDHSSEKLFIDIGSNVKITNCLYRKENEVKSEGQKCELAPPVDGKVQVTMKDRNNPAIEITYEGTYAPDGLYRERINNKEYYFASFANGAAANVLPCQKTDPTSFVIKFKQYKEQNMKNNINGVKYQDKIRLEDIVFIYGDFQTIPSGTANSLVEISGVINYGSNKLTTNGEVFSNEVLKKLATTLGSNTPASKVQQLLFPSSTLRDINEKYFTTHSLKNYAIQDKMGALREQSLRTDLIRRLSQHWFGASATSDKWLSTGLSTFLACYALDKLPLEVTKSKKFLALDQLVVDQLQLRAFEADGFTSSPSLKSFNKKTTTYDGVLSDPILYSKGASIMRSLFTLCGDEKFDAALKSYSALSPPTTVVTFAERFKDCFRNVDEAKSFLNQWHELSGYPVVHVERVNVTTGTFKLTQEKFEWMNGTDNKIWSLPIFYKLANGKEGLVPLSGASVDFTTNEKVNWIILNIKFSGYYRVNYDMATWEEIISQLEKDHKQIDPINRAQIIDDIFSFARSLRKYSKPVPDYKMALNLFNYLKKEHDYIPLKAAFNAIEFLYYSLAGSQDHKLFMNHVKSLLTDLYKSNPLNKISEVHVENLLTSEVGSWSCKMGIEGCVNLAKQYYENKTKDDNFVLPDNIKEIVYCTMARNNENIWDNIFITLTLSLDKLTADDFSTYLNALGCTADVSRVKRLITWSQTSEPNYFLEVISSLFNGNPGNIQTILEMLKQQKKAVGLDVKLKEKIVQLSLRKLNEGNAKSLSAFVKDVLPESNEMRKEAELILTAVDKWSKQKVGELHQVLTSGQSRAKSFGVIVILCAVFPVFSYLLRY